jgi:hypothetical protein
VEDSYEAIFTPLIEELRKKPADFPKIIIYAPLNWCGYGHELALRSSPERESSCLQAKLAQYLKPCTSAVSIQ